MMKIKESTEKILAVKTYRENYYPWITDMMIQKIYGETHHKNVLRRVSTQFISSNVQEKRIKLSEAGDTIMDGSKKSRKICHFCPKRNMRAKRTRGFFLNISRNFVYLNIISMLFFVLLKIVN